MKKGGVEKRKSFKKGGVEFASSLNKLLSPEQKETYDLLYKEYLTVKQIAQRRGVTKTAVYKTIAKLREKGMISRGFTKGLKKMTVITPPKGGKWRLHSQQFDIKIIYKGDSYDRLRSKRNMLFLDGNTVKLHERVVEVYCNELMSFWGLTPGDAEEESFRYWMGFFDKLEQKLGVILVKEGVFSVNQSKAHLAHVGDGIAEDYVKRGLVLRVYAAEDGKLCMVVDQSHGVVELEFLHPKKYKLDADKVSGFLEGLRHYDGFTPKFLVDSLGALSVSQEKTVVMIQEILERLDKIV